MLADSRETVPESAILFSSAREDWSGGIVSRFRLQKMREETYCYSGHLLAIPRSGAGELIWQFEGRHGNAPVRPGGVSIQPAGRFMHRCEMRNVICDTLNLDAAWLQGLLTDERHVGKADLRPLPSGEDRLLQHWMDLLIACIPRNGEVGAKLEAEEVLTRIGVHLLQNHGTDRFRFKRYVRGLEPWRLKNVFEYVEVNLSRPVSLSMLAQAAGGISLFHFCRLFRQSTGMTPHRYVQRVRLSRARGLLESGSLDLLAVALETGFCDHSHLTRSFKRVFGITPSEFQRRKKSKNVQTQIFGLS